MSGSDLQRLLAADADRSLAGLEADIWAATAARLEGRRVFRAAIAAQAALLAGLAIGGAWAQSHLTTSRYSELDSFSLRPSLAASTLLLEGDR